MRPILLLLGVAVASLSSQVWADESCVSAPPGHKSQCKVSKFNCKLPNLEEPTKATKEERKGNSVNRKYNYQDQSYFWELKSRTPVVDGTGKPRGHNTTHTRLNFGQRKTIKGVPHVYAFGLSFHHDPFSDWIPESQVKNQHITEMRCASPKRPSHGYSSTSWVVTGGKLASDGKSLALNERFGNRKVNPNIKLDDHQAASDYLVRSWGTATIEGDPATQGYVNFLYNLPGVGGAAADTLPLCRPFKAFKDVKAVTTKLYFVDSASKSDLKLHFVFGEMDGRRGWMTMEMLTKASDVKAGKLGASHPCVVKLSASGGGGGDDSPGDTGGAAGTTSDPDPDDPGYYGEFGDDNDPDPAPDAEPEDGDSDIEMVDESTDLEVPDDTVSEADGSTPVDDLETGAAGSSADGTGGTSSSTGGTGTSSAGGSGGSGTKHVTPLPDDDGGCTVNVAGAAGRGGAALGLVLGLGLLARRRRRP